MPSPRRIIKPARPPAPSKPVDDSARRYAELLAKARAAMGRSPVPPMPRGE